MPQACPSNRVVALLIGCAVGAAAAGFAAHDAHAAGSAALQRHEKKAALHTTARAKPGLDPSGRRHVGKASFYAKKFSGRKMADGSRMNPQQDIAASKTLPLGSTAKVTNLETGKSTVVTIKDRGPYVKDRIVDLSPAAAQKVGITRGDGVAKVEVVPLTVPQPDGRVKPGVAAPDANGDKRNNGERRN